MESYKEIQLNMTCGACPEQYDAIYNDENIGYLRLRYGYFRAEFKGQTVYETETIGDGCFENKERKKHLKKAKKAIFKAFNKNK